MVIRDRHRSLPRPEDWSQITPLWRTRWTKYFKQRFDQFSCLTEEKLDKSLAKHGYRGEQPVPEPAPPTETPDQSTADCPPCKCVCVFATDQTAGAQPTPDAQPSPTPQSAATPGRCPACHCTCVLSTDGSVPGE